MRDIPLSADTYLVKLSGALHVNPERNARVFSLFSCGALQQVFFSLGEAASHRLPNIIDEAFVVYTNDFQLEGTWVLEVINQDQQGRCDHRILKLKSLLSIRDEYAKCQRAPILRGCIPLPGWVFYLR